MAQTDPNASPYADAYRLQRRAYNDAVARLAQGRDLASQQVSGSYDALADYLSRNQVNPYASAPRAQAPSLDPGLSALFRSQNVDPSALNAEVGLREQQAADTAAAFNRQLDMLAYNRDQLNQARMEDVEFARRAADANIKLGFFAKSADLMAQNMAGMLGISMAEAAARVQKELEQMRVAAQLQAAQISANATLGAAKISADAAKANVQAQLAAQQAMQKAGFDHEKAMLIAKQNFEEQQWFQQASLQEQKDIRNLQFQAAVAVGDIEKARKIAEANLLSNFPANVSARVV